MAGNKLAYGEVNHLIRSLMYAFILADEKHVEEVMKLDELPPGGIQEQNNTFSDDEDGIFLTQNKVNLCRFLITLI